MTETILLIVKSTRQFHENGAGYTVEDWWIKYTCIGREKDGYFSSI